MSILNICIYFEYKNFKGSKAFGISQPFLNLEGIGVNASSLNLWRNTFFEDLLRFDGLED